MRQCRPPGSLPAPCGRGASAVVGCRRAACRLIPGVQLVAGGWQPAPCRRLATKRQAPRRRLPGQCGRRSKMVRARGHAWTRGRRCRAGLGARAPTGPTHASCPYRFCARTRRLQGARRLAALIGRNWCGPFLIVHVMRSKEFHQRNAPRVRTCSCGVRRTALAGRRLRAVLYIRGRAGTEVFSLGAGY